MKFSTLSDHPSFLKMYEDAGVKDVKNELGDEEINVTNYNDIQQFKETFKTLIEADIKNRKAKKELDELITKREQEKQYNNAIKTATSLQVGELLPKFKIPAMRESIQRIVTNEVFMENKDKFKIQDGELTFDGETEEVKQYPTELSRLLAEASVLRFGQEKPTLTDIILKHVSEFMCMVD